MLSRLPVALPRPRRPPLRDLHNRNRGGLWLLPGFLIVGVAADVGFLIVGVAALVGFLLVVQIPKGLALRLRPVLLVVQTLHALDLHRNRGGVLLILRCHTFWTSRRNSRCTARHHCLLLGLQVMPCPGGHSFRLLVAASRNLGLLT